MEKLIFIIKLLITKRFSGTLEVEFFEGGIRSAHQREKVI